MSRILYCSILYIALSIPGIAQDSLYHAEDMLSKKELKQRERNYLLPGRPWTVDIPLWIPGFAGEFAYGDVEIEGEDGVKIENPIEPEPPGGGIGDILSRLFTTNWYLKFFYLTKVSYEQNKFKGQLDLITGAVGNSVQFNYNKKEVVSAGLFSLWLRGYAGYKFLELSNLKNTFRYEAFAYGGLRTYFQKLESQLDERSGSIKVNPVLLEPLVGIENQFTWKRFFLNLSADYGGIHSLQKRSVQLNGFIKYRTGRLTSIKGGWNHLYVRQKDTFLGEDYKAKMTLSGPTVALAFHF